ncbi:MAG: hypothetical protein Q9214_000994 [Letrouitia sp. 1 TL-2023]
MSITGRPLHLDLPVSFRGWFPSRADGVEYDSRIPGSCATAEAYEKLNQLGEAYGVVFRARERSSSQIVALKQVRTSTEERQNGLPITALREISILRSLRHENIVNVLEVAVGESAMDEIYMVMEYCEQDMATILDELDVKMQNILLTAKGVLKLADFGMARMYSARPLTAGVVTIWYRAPELLLGTKHYSPSVDLWSAGLVLAELLQSEPCLTGDSPIEQLSLIVKLLGSPTPNDMATLSTMGCPDLLRWRRESLASGRADNIERRYLASSSSETVTLLKGLLKWEPQARWTAAEALGRGKSRYALMGEEWWKESPRAVEKELLPTYPEVRNKAALGDPEHRGKHMELGQNQTARGGKAGDYLFEFDTGVASPLLTCALAKAAGPGRRPGG